MDYTDYMILKAISLCIIVFFVNLIYSFITGRTLEEARRDTHTARKEPRN